MPQTIAFYACKLVSLSPLGALQGYEFDGVNESSCAAILAGNVL